MGVWRKQCKRYFVNGKLVTRRTPEAVATTVYSKRFYGTLRFANGKRKQVPLTKNRKTSEALLRRLQVATGVAGQEPDGWRRSLRHPGVG